MTEITINMPTLMYENAIHPSYTKNDDTITQTLILKQSTPKIINKKIYANLSCKNCALFYQKKKKNS